MTGDLSHSTNRPTRPPRNPRRSLWPSIHDHHQPASRIRMAQRHRRPDLRRCHLGSPRPQCPPCRIERRQSAPKPTAKSLTPRLNELTTIIACRPHQQGARSSRNPGAQSSRNKGAASSESAVEGSDGQYVSEPACSMDELFIDRGPAHAAAVGTVSAIPIIYCPKLPVRSRPRR